MSDKKSLYIIVNLSSSILAYKNKLIKNEEILLCIMEYTRHADPQIRIAALWCIINFSWSDDDYGHIVRVSKLCELGFEKRLFEMLFNDQNIDVKDGARTALLNFGHTILNNNVVGSEAEISNQRSDNTFAQESSIT